MDTRSMWVVTAGYSTSIFVANSFEEAQKKYIKALNTPNDIIREKTGYCPGSFATENILGKHEAANRCYSPWVNSYDKLEYTLENLNNLMKQKEPLITFKSVHMDDMVLTSHLDG